MPTQVGLFPKQYGSTRITEHDNRATGVMVTQIQAPVSVSYSTGAWRRESVRTPNFTGMVNLPFGQKMDLPMNPFLYTNDHVVIPYVVNTYIQFQKWNGRSYTRIDEGTQNLGNYVPARSTSDLAWLISRASTKFRSKLKDQNFNLGIVVGEGGKTISMIAKKATAILNSARAIKRGDLRGAARFLNVEPRKGSKNRWRDVTDPLARSWLELQYGWKPLMSDIYHGAMFLGTQNEHLVRQKLTIGETKFDNGRQKVVVSGYRTEIDEWSTTHTVKYVVYFSQPKVASLPFALGLENPAAIAWELVPFSFVLDWFLPIGAYLENVNSDQGLSFVKGCRTEFWRAVSVRTRVGTVSEDVNYRISEVGSSQQVWTGIRCERAKLNGFPSNSFPSFKNPLSVHHAITALSLLATALKR